MSVNKATLGAISTPELIAELVRRCAPAVFIGYKDEGGDGSGVNIYFNKAGNPFACYGLCHQAAMRLMCEEISFISNGEEE